MTRELDYLEELFGVVLRMPSDGLEIPFLVLPIGAIGGGVLGLLRMRALTLIYREVLDVCPGRQF